MYANDYDDISTVKQIADRFKIAIVLVHHLRKLKDSTDPFNEVSGSTGITGAADTNFILKRRRGEETATLLVNGRDVEYQQFTLRFVNQVWQMVEHKDSAELHREEIPQFLFRLVDFLKDKTEWTGTATDLLSAMRETETPPNLVTKILGRFAGEVFAPAGIEYKTKRTGQSRLMRFRKGDSNDDNDGNSVILEKEEYR
jgi:hypothetical protein